MILYHGTDQIIDSIDFSKSRLRTDFGRGFYMSDRLGNAQDWAVDKSGLFGTPTVMRYEVKDAIFHDDTINSLRFNNPTLEWLNFVRDNRRRDASGNNTKEPRHSYDVVSGPIANDKVAIAVDKYCRGKLNAEETLQEVKAIKNVFQLSIHTPLALTYIEKITYSQRVNNSWTKWRNC